MRTCKGCATAKEPDKFWKGQYLCIECSKWRQKNSWQSRTPKKRLEQHLKYKYGVTHGQFVEAWDEQDGKCAICRTDLPDLMKYDNRRRGYAIDHNHETRRFRGILCLKCNSLLGMAMESTRVLANAIGYLQKKGSYSTDPFSEAPITPENEVANQKP